MRRGGHARSTPHNQRVRRGRYGRPCPPTSSASAHSCLMPFVIIQDPLFDSFASDALVDHKNRRQSNARSGAQRSGRPLSPPLRPLRPENARRLLGPIPVRALRGAAAYIRFQQSTLSLGSVPITAGASRFSIIATASRPVLPPADIKPVPPHLRQFGRGRSEFPRRLPPLRGHNVQRRYP